VSRRPSPARLALRAKTRQQLLDIATSLFRSYGWQNTSARQLAEAAGRSAPAIYDHFGSMEGLWEAAMHCPAPDPVSWAARVQAQLQRGDIGQAQAQLAAFILQWQGDGL